MRRLAMVLVTMVAFAAAADEATYVFQSEEDPATPPDPTVCAGAPFMTNAKLGASLWSVKTKRHDGKVTERRKKIGRATACLGLTNLLFPAGLVQNFFVQFDLPQGRYVASGTCTVTSNDVPETFIILAGCTLKIITEPAGGKGGIATSSSVLNPLHRPGYSTGSTWTLHEYLAEATTHHHGWDDEDEDD
jgi:hypothetical protein